MIMVRHKEIFLHLSLFGETAFYIQVHLYIFCGGLLQNNEVNSIQLHFVFFKIMICNNGMFSK